MARSSLTAKRVDSWAAKQEDKPGRSEAIRRLVEAALAATGPTPKRSKKAAAKAAEAMSNAAKHAADAAAQASQQMQEAANQMKQDHSGHDH